MRVAQAAGVVHDYGHVLPGVVLGLLDPDGGLEAGLEVIGGLDFPGDSGGACDVLAVAAGPGGLGVGPPGAQIPGEGVGQGVAPGAAHGSQSMSSSTWTQVLEA